VLHKSVRKVETLQRKQFVLSEGHTGIVHCIACKSIQTILLEKKIWDFSLLKYTIFFITNTTAQGTSLRI
jgi:hypothetical protein